MLKKKIYAKDFIIKEVWDFNMEAEFFKIMDLIEEYNIISIVISILILKDTEFPGAPFSPKQDFEYQLIRENVNHLNIIQLGISLANERGEFPAECSTWQFNFRYDLDQPESIQLLKNCKINFEQLKQQGCDSYKFAEMFIASGLVLNEDVIWVCFHGGFDFAYLLKLLTQSSLPGNFEQFNKYMKLFFPKCFDLKYLIKDYEEIKFSGLNRLAQELKVERFGQQHQAGSDSHLTSLCFFKLQERFFDNELPPDRFDNLIFGIGKGFVSYKNNFLNHEFNYRNDFDSFAFGMTYGNTMYSQQNLLLHEKNFNFMQNGKEKNFIK